MGGVIELLARASDAGLRLEAEGDRLLVRGPSRAGSLAQEILSRKAEVLVHLRHPSWESLQQDRWGPAVGDPTPGIDIPEPASVATPRLPWRSELANWPVAWRERWGRRANQLEDEGHDWRESERMAFEAVRAERVAKEGPYADSPTIETRPAPISCF